MSSNSRQLSSWVGSAFRRVAPTTANLFRSFTPRVPMGVPGTSREKRLVEMDVPPKLQKQLDKGLLLIGDDCLKENAASHRIYLPHMGSYVDQIIYGHHISVSNHMSTRNFKSYVDTYDHIRACIWSSSLIIYDLIWVIYGIIYRHQFKSYMVEIGSYMIWIVNHMWSACKIICGKSHIESYMIIVSFCNRILFHIWSSYVKQITYGIIYDHHM